MRHQDRTRFSPQEGIYAQGTFTLTVIRRRHKVDSK
jgi:hypothetical protein